MNIDAIYNGYLRLYCKIMGIRGAPKRCRVCGGVLDQYYRKRRSGYLCLECYRKDGNRRSALHYKRYRA